MEGNQELRKKKKLIENWVNELHEAQADQLLKILNQDKNLFVEHLLDYLKS